MHVILKYFIIFIGLIRKAFDFRIFWIYTDSQIHSIYGVGGTTDDATLATLLPRVIDLEEADRETSHLLVFLLMQFLSRSDQASPTEEKHVSRTQSIIFKHLYLLFGYNVNDKNFHIPPYKMR